MTAPRIAGPPPSSGAIFVLPTTTRAQLGPVASWISTAGWAAAARRVLGQAWIVTPEGILDVDEVRRRATATSPRPRVPRGRRAAPVVLKTAVKDVREARRARGFAVPEVVPWSGHEVAFVWQRHELFHDAGIRLARRLGVPSVLFVPALTVQQARGWGVARPGWGRWLERWAEVPALRSADVVACGTGVVADQVAALGVPAPRIVVTPTGADVEHFARRVDRPAVRAGLGIGPEVVVGWVGSFRGFHQLDQLLHAAAGVDGVRLLLVGDGPERSGVERTAAELGVEARLPGLVGYDAMPDVLGAMDLAVVLAEPGRAFHYSPLKLAEYLAAGVPVLVPDVPELVARLEGTGGWLAYPTGDVAALRDAIAALAADAPRRREMAGAARRMAGSWGWEGPVREVLARAVRADQGAEIV